MEWILNHEAPLNRKEIGACYDVRIQEDHLVPFLRKVLKEWKSDIEAKPWTAMEKEMEYYKETKKGLQTFMDTKERLEDKFVNGVYRALRLAEERRYVEANEAYFGLSIGNAVVQSLNIFSVSIHARAVDNKRKRAAEAPHYFDNRTTKTILLAVKRVISFCEKKTL